MDRRPPMRDLLLRAQAWWDAQRFDQSEWHLAAWPDQKVRHIQLHVAKALGKVVAALEGGGSASDIDPMARVRDEVLPDAAIYRSQLINTIPEGGLPPRRGSVPTLWPSCPPPPHPVSAPAAELLFRVVVSLGRASAQLAAYIEPREHGAKSPASSIQEAIQDLHDSAEALATYLRSISPARTRHAWKCSWGPSSLRLSSSTEHSALTTNH